VREHFVAQHDRHDRVLTGSEVEARGGHALAERARVALEAVAQLGGLREQVQHPIVPIMLGDEVLAHRMADAMLEEGIYVIGFSFPVVPKGAARIRVQLSAAHTDEQIDRAIEAFIAVGERLGVVG
jgi:glycine C-acetyltransferase